ncbi:hypothetical protein MNEG_14078 [Monoraphidium neglectum]|uniref:Sugar fermentation stimulation protein C-terminal domain-containing protein n=1 Tax=Monoraphidium neglectum TaxID=145388 RepID=A0A0D2MFK4_9CHLO|nr:hypothetical protein MNEG_14078 [Monoraphidium neglectum]KIY93885.1 hypothetical protein MNEG_14078 [Monoraphidium neglectum]|eukprot:XP_013892905.1 hypothetical protein MNEG_14078 [Monoraphidium neglectum]
MSPHPSYRRVLRQQTFGSTRVDFVLEREGGGLLLLEVKNVVCADYPDGGVPEGRSKVGVYTSPAKPYVRTAIFPHGAQKKAIGVVSDRAIKHLHELTLLQRQGAVQPPPRLAAALSSGGGGGGGGGSGVTVDADGRVPAQAAVLFVVNRPDCEAFRPCHEACPMLARVLRRAEDAGVAVLAYSIDWEGGKAFWGRRLPVVYGADVSGADVDEAHLARVLEFNATDPRTHWKADRRSPKTSPAKPAKSKAAETTAEAEAIEAAAPEVEESPKPKGKRRAANAGKHGEAVAAGIEEEGGGAAAGGIGGAKKRGSKRAAAAAGTPAPATPEQPARRRGRAVASDGGALLDGGGPAAAASGSRAKRTRTRA